MLYANEDGIATPRKRGGNAPKSSLLYAVAAAASVVVSASSARAPQRVGSGLTSTSSNNVLGNAAPSSASASTDGLQAAASRSHHCLAKNLAVRGGAQDRHDKESNQSKGPKKHTKKHGQPTNKKDDDQADESEDTTASHAETREARKHKSTNKRVPSRIVQDILDQDDYYEILGLSSSQVKQAADPLHLVTKAYRRRCVHTHPDKTGGDRRAFDKVADAYHVLSDDSKRKVYDRFGKKGLQHHQDGGGPTPFGGFGNLSPDDLFRSFFEGGSPFRQQAKPSYRANRTTRYQLEVSLLDLYQGLTKTVKVAPPAPNHFQARNPDPSSIKSVQVHIPRGSLNGASIVLSGAVDYVPNQPPADLVFVLRQVPHPIFQRKGYDLAMTLTISLSEALCGFTKTLSHLDGKPLRVAFGEDHLDSNATQLTAFSGSIQTGDVHVLKGKGMPKDEVGHSFGDLYIVYKVVMPRNTNSRGDFLTREERRDLKRLLSKLEGSALVSKSPVNEPEPGSRPPPHVLKQSSLSDFGRASGQPPKPADPSLDTDSPTFEENEHTHRFSASPFGNHFFFSSGTTGAAAANPFTGMQTGFDEEDERVQCRQM